MTFFLAILLGVIDPTVTINQVCTPGYSASVRPSMSYTRKLKIKQMKAQGLQGTPSAYEEDHFIPLELGGSPKDPNNLWPQPWPEARLKDKDETRLHRAVCAGEMTLEQAQAEIRTLWSK